MLKSSQNDICNIYTNINWVIGLIGEKSFKKKFLNAKGMWFGERGFELTNQLAIFN